jgi:hypothetical protein
MSASRRIPAGQEARPSWLALIPLPNGQTSAARRPGEPLLEETPFSVHEAHKCGVHKEDIGGQQVDAPPKADRQRSTPSASKTGMLRHHVARPKSFEALQRRRGACCIGRTGASLRTTLAPTSRQRWSAPTTNRHPPGAQRSQLRTKSMRSHLPPLSLTVWRSNRERVFPGNQAPLVQFCPPIGTHPDKHGQNPPPTDSDGDGASTQLASTNASASAGIGSAAVQAIATRAKTLEEKRISRRYSRLLRPERGMSQSIRRWTWAEGSKSRLLERLAGIGNSDGILHRGI